MDCATGECRLNLAAVDVEGDYFEFFAGDNAVTVTGATGTIETVYPFRVFYGED